MEHFVVQGVMNEITGGAAEYRQLLMEIEQTKKAQTLVAARLTLLKKLLALEGEQVEDVAGTYGTKPKRPMVLKV